MPRKSKPVLRSWSDLSAREQSPRELHDKAKDRAVEKVYVVNPWTAVHVSEEERARAADLCIPNGDPRLAQVASRIQARATVLTIWILWPRDGHGEQGVRVVAMQRDAEDRTWWYAGIGSDPTGALAGLPVLGAGVDVVCGGHCDHLGRPRLRDICDARGWMVFGHLGS